MPEFRMPAFNSFPEEALEQIVGVETTTEKQAPGIVRFQQNILLAGQIRPGGSLSIGEIQRVDSVAAIQDGAGVGSELAIMYEAAFRNTPNSTFISVLPLDSPTGATSAVTTITVTGDPTDNGEIAIYIAGRRVPVLIDSTMTMDADAVAARIHDEVSTINTLPVTSTVENNVVSLTANWSTSSGSDITVSMNLDGEILPPGVTVTIAQDAIEPTGDLSARAILDEINDDDGFTVIAFQSGTSNIELSTLEEGIAERWGPGINRPTIAVTAVKGTAVEARAHSAQRNNINLVMVGAQGIPNSYPEIVGALAGRIAESWNENPSLSYNTVPLTGLVIPQRNDRWTWRERNTALQNGLSTLTFENGRTQISQMRTTLQRVANNTPAEEVDRFLNSRQVTGVVVFDLRQFFVLNYPRALLLNEGGTTPFPTGIQVVTPTSIRSIIISRYGLYIAQGLTEDVTGFSRTVEVVRGTGPQANRVNVRMEIKVVANLRQLAILLGINFAA